MFQLTNSLSLQEEEERTGAKPATNQLVLNEVHSDQPKHHHIEKLRPAYYQCLAQLFSSATAVRTNRHFMSPDITFAAIKVVIDRGPSPYLSNIDLYLDGKLITSVQVN